MADKIPKQVLFSDGEALRSDDFNDLQKLIQAYVADGVLSMLGYSDDTSAIPSGLEQASAVGNGGAVFVDEATNLTVDFAPGMIGQHSGAAVTGDTPAMLWYYMEAADVPDKTRPVATTNPRWDILTVQLTEADGSSENRDFKDAITGALSTQSFNKRRRVTATFTWTQGTEAASPVEPAVPAGQVKLCAVKVPTAAAVFSPFGSGLDSSELRDYRVPVGFTTYRDGGHADTYFGTGTITFNASVFGKPPFFNMDVDVGEFAYGHWWCPVSSPTHRLKKITMRGEGPDTTAHEFILGDGNATGNLWPNPGFWGAPNSGYESMPRPEQDFNDFPPVWCNGYAAGYAAAVHSLYLDSGATTGFLNEIGPQELFLRHEIQPPSVDGIYEVHEVHWEIWGI